MNKESLKKFLLKHVFSGKKHEEAVKKAVEESAEDQRKMLEEYKKRKAHDEMLARFNQKCKKGDKYVHESDGHGNYMECIRIL